LGKGDRNVVVDLLAKHADHLTPPFRLFFCCGKRDPYENDRALADAVLLQCQIFAMQFVLFRPLTTVVNVMLHKYNYYGPWADGPRDWRAPQCYVILIQNLSISTAFAGLLKFYHAVDADLAWCVFPFSVNMLEDCQNFGVRV
jgi:Organic solute transporter Ostalpha